MQSCFHPKTASWKIAWPGRVSRYDLVYLSPPCDPMQGLALGNGDVGALCWCEESRIVFALNKCDLWDDAAFGRFRNWEPEQEDISTTLRHAGRLILEFHHPVFDIMYLTDFEARLSLADASLSITAASPFGRISLKAFLAHDEGCLRVDVDARLTEDVAMDVRLERYGSRTFSHWYSLVNRDARIGLDGTEASADKHGIYIEHQLTSGRFAVGCTTIQQPVPGLRFSRKREHGHAAKMSVSGANRKRFSLLASVISPLPDNPVAAVKKCLAAARSQDVKAVTSNHKRAWKAFWLRSLMESGDAYLDALWHVTMYYAKASQGAAYPGRFINGLWTWNRDVQNWNFYFHWNQQQTYWPLNAAGHHDLVDAYLEWRFSGLPHARFDARDEFQSDGAVVSDVSERRGYNSTTFENHTPVAQIALEFWRQYRFVGKREYLLERALPYLIEAAAFFESLLERDEHGVYHARSGTGYEGSIRLRDGVTDLAHARALFATTLEAVDEANAGEPRAARWRDILDHLTPLLTVPVEDGFTKSGPGGPVLAGGLFRGEPLPGNKLFAAGFGIEEERLLTSFVPSEASAGQIPALDDVIRALENNNSPYTAIDEGIACHEGIFPWAEFATVFPSGLITLADEGSEAFRTAVTTVKTFALAGMGWDPLPIVLARLGLANELETVLATWPGRWQFYCNGFGHYGPRDIVRADAALRFRTHDVRDASLPEERRETELLPFPAWPFRHMGMESMSVLACAMNEALLQSHDGVIRIAPAAGKGSARFTLHAEGGFVVSAEIENGVPRWVCVTSLHGNPCTIENPWDEAWISARGDEPEPMRERRITLSPPKGGRLLLAPSVDTIASWEVTSARHAKNAEPKTDALGQAQLGLPRMF
jgi:alpha-L-fucosidase 2